jgi:cytochrome c oxidase subunit II
MFKTGGLPIQGSDVAVMWDSLYGFLVWISVFFFILVVGGMIYLAIRYRKREGAKAKYITGNHTIEAIWTIVPTILLLVIFAWGYQVYNAMTRAPDDAMEVRVIGKQWLWQFQYQDGKSTIGELYVPINKPIKLVMSSEDVLHSFFIPNFRVKQDVVPGMYTSVWFEAKIAGQHQVYCTEYCGFSHSGMLAKVIVLEPAEWEAWKKGKPVGGSVGTVGASGTGTTEEPKLAAEGLPEQGRKLTEAKGCIACHSDTGEAKIGPSFKGVFGHDVELADGSKVKADENYLRESILKPQAKVVKGFNPVMPTFQGLLTEAEMNAIIAYIKSLK